MQSNYLKKRGKLNICDEFPGYFVVTDSYLFDVEGFRFEIPRWFLTDLASIPALFEWFEPTVGASMRGGLAHDWLYRLVASGLVKRSDADRVFRLMCIESGVSKWKAWAMWSVLRGVGGIRMRLKGSTGDMLPDEFRSNY